MKPDELLCWLALNEKRGIIHHYLLDIIVSKHGSLNELWSLNKKAITDLGLKNADATNLINYIDSINLEQYTEKIQFAKKNNLKIITYVDEEYPPILKLSGTAVLDPPFVLFRKGLKLDFVKTAAIVGTRKPSQYAETKARLFAKTLAQKKYWIISGMAFGIDYEAHCGALDVMGGRTVAVLPWMDPITPKSHTELSKRIIENGCIISDKLYRPASKAPSGLLKYPFIERNRITSGLANFLIAVESGSSGGTIRQVDLARSQNKDVYTLYPKTNDEAIIDGFNALIIKDAQPIDDISDIQLKKYDKYYEKIKQSIKKFDAPLYRLIYGYNEEDAFNRFIQKFNMDIEMENVEITPFENKSSVESFDYKYYLLQLPDMKTRPPCPRCGSEDIESRGHSWHCKTCNRYFYKKENNRIISLALAKNKAIK